MNITYRHTTNGYSLRTIHIIVIETESLTTTRGKEILLFAKPRVSRADYEEIARAVRLRETLTIRGGSDKPEDYLKDERDTGEEQW